ncbi:MAG: FkbM family methyltransferase [Saprospiraceae bacterium]|nr:FkbM family methyltransferase [Saprospiraceae bacterium]
MIKRLIRNLLLSVGFYVEKIRRNEFQRLDWRLIDHDLSLMIGHNLQDKKIIIDVGANKGQSIDKFKKLWPLSHIYSFEPDLELYEYLKNIYNRNEVTIINEALGESKGRIVFKINQKKGLNSILNIDKSLDNRFKNTEIVDSYNVNMNTLDSFCQALKEINIIHLLKIDVQGYDLNVLKGAVDLLKEGKVLNILVEMNFFPMYVNQAKPWEIMEFLNSYGFSLIGLYEISRSKEYKGHIAWCTALLSKKEKRV